MTTLPSRLRTWRCTLPVPWQMSHVTGAGPGLAARALTRLAEHRGVDVDVAVRAEHDVAELERHAHEGVLPALAPRTRAAAAPAAGRAEERLEDVVEAAEAAGAAERRVAAAHVVARALIGIAQHVVGVRHELEALGRVFAGVDVGVQLPRELAVRLLDLVGGGVA